MQSCSCGGKIEADIRGGDQFGTGDLICTKCGKIHEEKIYIRLEKPKEIGAAGSSPMALPSDLRVNVPTILKPRNPDEEL